MNAGSLPAVAPECFGELFSLHRAQVRRCLVRWGVPEADADDACTDVFVVAMRRLPSFEGRAGLTTWLLGVARHVASDVRRSARARHEVLVDRLPERECLERPDERLERAQASRAVRRAVSTLKPAQRQVVTGFLLEERPMKAVATAARVPDQTAYARLYAGLGALRGALAADWGLLAA